MYVNYHIYDNTKIELMKESLVLRLRGDSGELNIFLSEDDRKRLIKALEETK